jgi:hypothetical protein
MQRTALRAAADAKRWAAISRSLCRAGCASLVKIGSDEMTLHLLRMTGITTLIALCVFFPFLPGQYDSLALPLSTMAQAGAVVGLLLVPIGILWLVYELRQQVQRKQNRPIHTRRYYFALASVIAFLIVAMAVSLVAFATVGISLAFITITLGLFILSRLLSKLRLLKDVESNSFSPVPLYLVLIPIAVTLLQLTLAAPMTNFSRNHAIINSSEFIRDIEAYRAQYGRYPTSLLAMWKDYYPVLRQYSDRRANQSRSRTLWCPNEAVRQSGDVDDSIAHKQRLRTARWRSRDRRADGLRLLSLAEVGGGHVRTTSAYAP